MRGLIIVAACWALSACGAGSSLPVPVGTWKAVDSGRYMSIEQDAIVNNDTGTQSKADALFAPKTFTVTMFTYRDKSEPEIEINPVSSTVASIDSVDQAPKQYLPELGDNLIRLERTAEATLVEGVLTIQAGATPIPVLYHPSGELILVAGTSEFTRVHERGAQDQQDKEELQLQQADLNADLSDPSQSPES